LAETSGLWTTDGAPAGHQVVSYTQAIASDMLAIAAACSGFEGVAPGYSSELAPSSTGVNNVRIAAGGAMVDGKYYKNTANVDKVIANANAGNYRIDHVVLRATWADFDVTIDVLTNPADNTPAVAVTQTTGVVWEISLCTVSVTAGGVITITDTRKWALENSAAYSVLGRAISPAGRPDDITAAANDTVLSRTALGGLSFTSVSTDMIAANAVTVAKIPNRTRKFLVPPLSSDDDQAYSNLGLILVDGVSDSANGAFYVPSDFVSGMTVKAVLLAPSSGNIYSFNGAYHGAVGEDHNAHFVVENYAAVALTLNQRAEIQTLTLNDIAAGDYVTLTYIRNAASASDTINNYAHITGWIVEYTADS